MYIIIVFRYYHEGEIKNFENIECEWPLFYIFMIIDGVFKTLPDQIQEYQDLLKERIMIDHHGGVTWTFRKFDFSFHYRSFL